MIHMGVAEHGHVPEDTCPCEKMPCGLVPYASIHNFGCALHYSRSNVAIAQFHKESECPGYDFEPSLPGEQFFMDEYRQVNVIKAPKMDGDKL